MVLKEMQCGVRVLGESVGIFEEIEIRLWASAVSCKGEGEAGVS